MVTLQSQDLDASSSAVSSPRSIAQYYIAQECFHKRFILPSTDNHGEIPVTYADVGARPQPAGGHVPTVLFIPGMCATRYMGVCLHAIAEKIGVRVLIVDRPGMGGTASVPLNMRIPIWLELVRCLLAHLAIDHVSLMSHSAGTVYLLNTMFHCRDILHPQQPYVAFIAPWVDPARSRATLMKALQFIPTRAFSVSDGLIRFFIIDSAPVLAFSGAVGKKVRRSDGSSNADQNRLKIQEGYGVAQEVQVELEKCMLRSIFAENTVGTNSEALQCLKKGPSNWGKCDDYAEFVRDFAEAERTRSSSTQSKINVQAYFGETDIMIGKMGQTYFEACFTGKDNEFQDVLHFETNTIPGADHDSVFTSVEVLERVFREAKRSLSS